MPMKCRLLYLVGQLGPGGSERQLSNLLKGMDRDRYQPGVAVWNYRQDETYVAEIKRLGVPIFPLAPSLFAVKKMVQFRRLVRTLQPEIVHSYSFYINFAAYWATRGTPTIPLGSVRSDWSAAKQGSGPLLGTLSAHWPPSQICNSLAAAKAVCGLDNHGEPRVYVVRNGLDLSRFRVRPLPNTHKPYIAGIGSLLPCKRWDRLLRAAAALKRKGLDFLVRIVGGGPARSSLERQVQTFGIADCVELVGHSEHVPEILAEATFLAHTSDTEGCPNVIMEAMACARAVVATDVGDVSSLIEDGQTGYLVAPADERTLVGRMATLISQRDVCERMGEAGSAKANKEFGLDRMMRETLAAYRSAGWNG
jgi:glycosyltransferase involved in cell wall biosynthesis